MTDDYRMKAMAKLDGFWNDQIGLAMNTPLYCEDHNAVQRVVDKLDEEEIVRYATKLRQLAGDHSFLFTTTCRQKIDAILHCKGG
jgi:hypothetical protein